MAYAPRRLLLRSEMGKYRAIIFDLDGVLIDTEPLYLKATNLVVAQEGAIPISEEENKQHLLGTTVEETWRRVIRLRGLSEPLEHYVRLYDVFVRQVMQADLTAQPGVVRLIEEARSRDMPIAVASSSLREWIDLKLGAIGLNDAFDLILGGDQVTNGKPAPDIYLLAAQGLGVPPEECVAIEDSPTGIAAAVASGAYTIAVWTASTDGLDLSQSHAFLHSLEDFDLSLLG